MAGSDHFSLSPPDKDKYIHAYRLSDYDSPECDPISKVNKAHRIEASKGCHVFAASRPENLVLRMAVAIRNRIQLFIWKHSASSEMNAVGFPVDIASFLELEVGDKMHFFRHGSLQLTRHWMALLRDFSFIITLMGLCVS